MHIDIDRGLCIGAGQCARAAPNVFTQDDDGMSTLLPTPEYGGGGPVHLAVQSCPVRAITVVSED